MKKILLIFTVLLISGCGQDMLTIKSDSYGENSQVVVYFRDGIATKAVSETVFANETEAREEYNRIKGVELNAKIEGTKVTYEQKDFFKGKTKEEVKQMFQELEN